MKYREIKLRGQTESQKFKRAKARMDDQRMLSTHEAAAYIGVGRSYFHKLMKSGDGPTFIVIGYRRKYDRRDLDAWLKSRSYTGPTDDPRRKRTRKNPNAPHKVFSS